LEVVVGGGYRSFSFEYAILGLLVFGFIGFVTAILSGGFIANFLNMVDNIEKITSQQIPLPKQIKEVKQEEKT